MTNQYPYIVIDAPGHYGDMGTVWSRHHTFEAACKAARRSYARIPGNPKYIAVVARNDSNLRAGNRFYRDMPPTEVWRPGGYPRSKAR